MKTKKKILAVMLCAAFSLAALSGCGESGEEGKEKDGTVKDTAAAKDGEEETDGSFIGGLSEGTEKTEITVCVKETSYEEKWGDHFEQTLGYEYDEYGRQKKILNYRGERIVSEKEYEYDKLGNLIRIKVTGSDGTNEFSELVGEWEYDESGNMTKEVNYAGSNNRIHNMRKYEYDETGKLTKEYYYEPSYKPDGSLENDAWMEEYRSNHEYEYDVSGNMTRYVFSSFSGTIFTKEEWEYDASGNMTKYLDYRSNGEISTWEEWEYDASNKMTKYIRRTSKGSIVEWVEYEYDSAGNPTESFSCNSDTGERGNQKEEWTYDASGNLTKYVEYGWEQSISHQEDWEYDSSGNITKHKEYAYGGATNYQEEWEYDASGNMTRKTHSAYDNNGNVGVREEWIYDASGNMTKYDKQGIDTTAVTEWEYKTILVYQ